jgi:protein TonB
MFTRLPESNATRQRRAGGLTISTVVHVVLIVLAIRATAWTAPTPPRVESLKLLPYIEPPAPPAPRTARTSPTREGGRTSLPVPPPDMAPLGPIDIVPRELPPAGSMTDLIRPDDFRRTGPPLGDTFGAGRAPNVSAGAPWREEFVDRAIVAIPGTTSPRYPATLQNAGIEGEVRAQFVVDTLGRVEPETVRILESTHELFARAVRDALARARFVPAEAQGHKVRQLAEQAFTFRLSRDR